ncbi:hypothetical protein A3K63_03825 [Candidatus Micrarchaeota archaeon RBG_16_49_10]|nr:MAG: hypothetical protein A3K63_03825 [Candidatus Micrarchaeota archaeon RBG_16_49_10]
MLLTIGILIAVSLVLLQLRAIFSSQTKVAQENVIYSFSRDIQRIIEKSNSISGNTTFVYEPEIKDYSFGINSSIIEIQDKVTGQNISFGSYQIDLIPDYFEDAEKIYIRKVNDYGLISDKLCKDDGENCEIGYQCCGGYCWGRSPKKVLCNNTCAEKGSYAPDALSCCTGEIDLTSMRCIEKIQNTTGGSGTNGSTGKGDLDSCPASVNQYKDKYNLYKDTIYSAILQSGLDKYIPIDNAARLVAAIITAESGWDEGTTCQQGWGCGLMQVTGSCQYSWDEMTDPHKNIMCGVQILTSKISYMSDYNDYDFENLIKLTLASYNGGQGTLTKAIEYASDSHWDNVGTIDALSYGTEFYGVCFKPEHRTDCTNLGYDCYQCKALVIQVYVDKVYGYYQNWMQCTEKQPSGSGGGGASGQIIWPTKQASRITSCHGDTIWYGIHEGIDIGGLSDGEDVYAPADGVVEAVGFDSGGGNYLVIKLDNPQLWAVFFHLQKSIVNEGKRVSSGDKVAYVDNTGTATTATHLHFHLQNGLPFTSKAYDPCNYFDDKTKCNLYCGTPMG